MRKLVTVRAIDKIKPIDGADAIECAVIDGWTVVTKKGEFLEGDKCVFFEIDSFLPADDQRYSFLIKSGVKKDESGKERIRLKTVKLRKQLSQGLALPLTLFPELSLEEGKDYSEELDVIKYERPEPQSAAPAGNFPDYINKTDEERVQNIYKKFAGSDDWYIPTLKLDGSSITVIFVPNTVNEGWKHLLVNEVEELHSCMEVEQGQFFVCSRNLMLKYNLDSHFWKGFINSNIDKLLVEHLSVMNGGSTPVAVQGELMGPGIQGNREGLNDYTVYLFNIAFGVDNPTFTLLETLCEATGVNVVPRVGDPKAVFKESLEWILNESEGHSINHKVREGIVWKKVDGGHSFKSISNKFLLKGGD